MAVTMNDLTAHLPDTAQLSVLDDWRWLTGPDRHPILVTAMGHAFLHDMNDGSIHRLDTIAGTLTRVAHSAEEFQQRLADSAFVLEQFNVDAVVSLREKGVTLAEGEVYGFSQPLILGGAYDADNVMPIDLVLNFALTGKIHEQVRQLPPATPSSDDSPEAS